VGCGRNGASGDGAGAGMRRRTDGERGRRCGGGDGEVAHGRTAAAWAHAGWERTGAAGRAVEGGGGGARECTGGGATSGGWRRTEAGATVDERAAKKHERESEVVTGQERNMTCGPRSFSYRRLIRRLGFERR
jgi:hypothetical protein